MFADLEIANAFGACDYIPIQQLWVNIERLDTELAQLCTTHPNYADDLCLGNYLRAIMARQLLLKVDDLKNMVKLRTIHHKSMQIVFNAAKDVVYDHYVYYFARYENARMFIMEDNYDSAEQEIQFVLKANDKNQYNVGAGTKAKSKYSMENHILFKSHNCMSEIEELRNQRQQNQAASGHNDEDEDSDSASFASASSAV